MQSTQSFSEFRKHLKDHADEVCNAHAPLLVTRRDAPNLVVISEQDFNALNETLYLLSSPKNAQLLQDAMQEKKGQTFSSLSDLKKKMKSVRYEN